MRFRVHRSFRLLPGLRIHLSESGVSASIDGRGPDTLTVLTLLVGIALVTLVVILAGALWR